MVPWSHKRGSTIDCVVYTGISVTFCCAAVFAALPASLQCHLLVHIADTTTEVLRQCCIMLLVLRRYPEHIPKRGVSNLFL